MAEPKYEPNTNRQKSTLINPQASDNSEVGNTGMALNKKMVNQSRLALRSRLPKRSTSRCDMPKKRRPRANSQSSALSATTYNNIEAKIRPEAPINAKTPKYHQPVPCTCAAAPAGII